MKLHNLLQLPAPEFRWKRAGFLARIFFAEPSFLESNDSYIKAIIIRNTFVIGASAAALTLFLIYGGVYDYQLSVEVAESASPQDCGMVGYYSIRHAWAMSAITLLCSVYYLLLYIKNSDFSLSVNKPPRSANGQISGYVGLLIWVACVLASGYSPCGLGVFLGLMPLVKDSYIYLTLGFLVMVFLHPVGAVCLHWAECWAYQGKRTVK
ncbi:MAG: hypothetical protein ACXW4B_06200 [Micavibrio sp.]